MDGGNSAIKLEEEECGGRGGGLAAYVHLYLYVHACVPVCVSQCAHVLVCMHKPVGNKGEEEVRVWQTKSPFIMWVW